MQKKRQKKPISCQSSKIKIHLPLILNISSSYDAHQLGVINMAFFEDCMLDTSQATDY